MVSAGDEAPDFTLMSHDRSMFTLSEVDGRAVIAFYPAAFTGVCTKEMCTFSDSLNSLNDANVAIFGICTM